MDSKTTSPPQIAFLGASEALELAYPETLRKEIGGLGRLLEPDLRMETWREHPGVLRAADYLLTTWGVPVLDAGFLTMVPNLRALFYAAGTVKGFVTPEVFARGIVICNANQANAIPVAEYAVSAIILSLKRFWQHALGVRRSRGWNRLSVPGAYRSVVGLVSLGAVGRITAEKLRNFELDVLAYDPFATPDQAAALGVRLVSLEEIFSQSDVVSLHTPWLPETEDMINGRLLRMMKSGATLLNTSRGAVINEGDLCQVLRERSDLTAVLDVTHPEPPEAEGALFALDNVFMTPHISGSMGGEVTRMGRWMVDELIRHRNGEPLRYAVTEQMLATAA